VLRECVGRRPQTRADRCVKATNCSADFISSDQKAAATVCTKRSQRSVNDVRNCQLDTTFGRRLTFAVSTAYSCAAAGTNRSGERCGKRCNTRGSGPNIPTATYNHQPRNSVQPRGLLRTRLLFLTAAVVLLAHLVALYITHYRTSRNCYRPNRN